MRKTLAIIAGVICSAAEADAPVSHLGPVTDILCDGDEIYSCSHAGVFRGIGPSLEKVSSPPFRAIALAPAPSGLLLAGGGPGESGLIGVQDLLRNKLQGRKIDNDLAYSAATSGNTGFVAMADGKILEFNIDDRAQSTTVRHQHSASAQAVKLSPNGRLLASAGMDRLVLISEWKRAGKPITIQDHTGPVLSLGFSPDSTRIASGSRDGKVRIHSAADGNLIRTYSGLDGEVTAVAWGEKPEQLLAGTTFGKIYRLDLSNDTAMAAIDWSADSPISALAINAKGAVFAGSINRLESVNLPE